MLTRSYLTLGEKEKAAAAIKDARAALADDAARLQLFNEALQRFKIDEIATVGVGYALPSRHRIARARSSRATRPTR